MFKITPLKLFVCLCLAAGLAGCSQGVTAPPAAPGARPSATSGAAAPTPAQTAAPAVPTRQVPTDNRPAEAMALPIVKGELFSASGSCAGCHTALKDETGGDVSLDSSWRASMLANSARDPYWRATVRSEISHLPALQAEIEKKCATCHMPMAAETVSAAPAGQSRPVQVLDGGFADSNHALHTLALDGVSCTLCHQLKPDNFGASGSFSGGFLISSGLPGGGRAAYGRFPPSKVWTSVMQGATGFAPVEAAHLIQAEACSACHNLVTPYVDKDGKPAGSFPEQMIYTEWATSGYRNRQTCQDCHLPPAPGSAALSNMGSEARTPFPRHIFVGGNAYMLRILQANGEALQTTTLPEQFEQAIARTSEQMSNQAADLALEQVTLQGTQLEATVAVTSLVGHKFPAGFPSRRAWLHFTVTGAQGQVLFESGAVRPDGSVVGNANDEDPARFEPHYGAEPDRAITAADQVQIYEAIMADTDGGVTTNLLRGAHYVKDNRLLPQGFDLQQAPPEVGVYGEADQDGDFLPGTDRLVYRVELGAAPGPLTVTVELLYQSIGFRWAENIRQQTSAEAGQFAQLSLGVSNLPLVAATAQASLR